LHCENLPDAVAGRNDDSRLLDIDVSLSLPEAVAVVEGEDGEMVGPGLPGLSLIHI